MVLLIEVAVTLGYMSMCVHVHLVTPAPNSLIFNVSPKHFLLKEMHRIIISMHRTIKYNKFLYTAVSNSNNSTP